MTEVILQGQTSARIAITGSFDQEAKLVRFESQKPPPPRTDGHKSIRMVMLQPNSGMACELQGPLSFDGFRKIKPER
jgi:hypothetical protein